MGTYARARAVSHHITWSVLGKQSAHAKEVYTDKENSYQRDDKQVPGGKMP